MAGTYRTTRRHPPPPMGRSPPVLRTYHTDVVMEDGTVIGTTVTSKARDVVLFLREFHGRQGLIVGLDTEWRRSFQPGGPRYRIAVLQLCVGCRCLVFQIVHADYVPAELVDFLAHPGVRFVGVGIEGDVQRLLEDCCLEVANAVNLGGVAADVLCRPKLRQAGLKTLALEVMGVCIDKPHHVTMSKWAARPLSREQVTYACIDAFLSFDIGRRLLTGR